MHDKRANATTLRLLTTAERLFAEEGIDAVSIRRISSEAGQRNNSALQYHFESKNTLIEAILQYRQGPINARRMQLLDRIEREGLGRNVHAIVEALVLPFVELLHEAPQHSYYVSVVSQLYSQQRLDMLFPPGRERTRSLLRATAMLQAALPAQDTDLRLQLMGYTLHHSVAQWAHERRAAPNSWPAARIRRQAATLVAFLVGGLEQPAIGADQWLLLANEQ